MDMLFFKQFYIAFEVLASLVGFLNWHKIKGSIWQYFPIYLAIIALSETATWLMPIPMRSPFNIYFVIPFEFLFFFWLLFGKLPKYQTPIIVGSLLYLFVFFYEILFQDMTVTKDVFFSISYTVGNTVLLVFIMFYFYELMNSDRIVYFYQERLFWVTLGLMLFFLGTLPYYGLFNYLRIKHFTMFYNYTWGVIALDYIMYLLFTFSLVGRKTN